MSAKNAHRSKIGLGAPPTTHASSFDRVVVLATGEAVLGGARPLAGVQQLPALVEVGARLEDEVVRQPVDVAGPASRLPGDEVVPRVPDHRGVVPEHAEMVRGLAAHGVDVEDVVGHTAGIEGVGVRREVVRYVGSMLA